MQSRAIPLINKEKDRDVKKKDVCAKVKDSAAKKKIRKYEDGR